MIMGYFSRESKLSILCHGLGFSIVTGILCLVIPTVPVHAAGGLVSLGDSDIAQIIGDEDSQFGWAVDQAGDMNGDGFGDVIVGAAGSDGTKGAAYIILGSSAGITAQTLADNSVIKFSGEAIGDYAGFSVAGVGDLNADGYDEVVVGAYKNDAGGSDAGAAYIVYGSSTLSDITLSAATTTKMTGQAAGDYAGFSVASAGDYNHDGFLDMLVGAPLHGASDTGCVYLVYGRATLPVSDPTLAASGTITKYTGESASDQAGTAVATAGDINNDDYGDIIIGAPGHSSERGAVYILTGEDFPSSATLSSSNAIKYTGEATGDQAGSAVAGVGDMNGDGFDDSVIGAKFNDAGGSDSGAVYIILNGLSSVDLTLGTVNSNIIKLIGEDALDLTGYSVGFAGDLNNDGYNDVFIGSLLNAVGDISGGSVYLLYGSASLQHSFLSSSSAVKFVAEQDDNFVGQTVASAGDVNNDGKNDFIIGAYGYTETISIGAAYVVSPQAIGTTLTGSSSITHECATTYSDAGATAVDPYTNTTLTVTTTGTVTTTTPNTSTLTYTAAANIFNLQAIKTRSVVVTDTRVPVITRTGEASITITQGSAYSDAGATATDSCDTSVSVSTAGTVNTNTAGSYTLTYSATDDSGNNATTVTRTITVVAAEDSTTSPTPTEDHGLITAVTKNQAVLTINYEDGAIQTVDPFTGKSNFRYLLSDDQSSVIITNGKTLYIYTNGVKVAQKNIGKVVVKHKYYSLKQANFYSGYNSIIIAVNDGHKNKLTVIRLLSDHTLAKMVSKNKTIVQKNPIKLSSIQSRHIITVRSGSKQTLVVVKYKLTKKGELKIVE